jgi:hypothetical protein
VPVVANMLRVQPQQPSASLFIVLKAAIDHLLIGQVVSVVEENPRCRRSRNSASPPRRPI